MISLEGDKQFPFPRATVWAKLTDMHFLVECLPDKGEVTAVTPDKADLVIQPQIAFLKGKLTLSISKVKEEAPNLSQLKMETKGIGSSSTAVATFQLGEEGGQTKMHWKAEVQQLGGLLKAVPSGFLKGAGQKVIGDILANVEKKLGERA